MTCALCSTKAKRNNLCEAHYANWEESPEFRRYAAFPKTDPDAERVYQRSMLADFVTRYRAEH